MYAFFVPFSVPSATGRSRKRVHYKSIRGNTKAFGRILAASVTPNSVKKVSKKFTINIIHQMFLNL